MKSWLTNSSKLITLRAASSEKHKIYSASYLQSAAKSSSYMDLNCLLPGSFKLSHKLTELLQDLSPEIGNTENIVLYGYCNILFSQGMHDKSCVPYQLSANIMNFIWANIFNIELLMLIFHHYFIQFKKRWQI